MKMEDRIRMRTKIFSATSREVIVASWVLTRQCVGIDGFRSGGRFSCLLCSKQWSAFTVRLKTWRKRGESKLLRLVPCNRHTIPLNDLWNKDTCTTFSSQDCSV
jgi:hypothetical protein